ncbi:MAG: hypothetical protein GTO45_35910 [Candidatus Aminicenantes bacterium]|nr:hypothetical protein [Candidatus Aminicenantes bacterium]NIM84075.1 hypothetical protein [Candidatus Aminicenantes bacterium]NIN23538.1 hypothetical protein [Candidatus Aminicenantes bacterium]NIN47243.1 hypothetical protein [Candidatus Aminicenantes bacterium]NIN90170.1 hypothetical protein [Candidatus Aminicenantes bacterium]
MKGRLLPPKYLNAFLVLEIGLHFIFPIQQLIHAPYTYLGFVNIGIGIVLNVYSGGFLRRMNTTIDFHETATELVVTGPFRMSRNPIYLSVIILSLGIAILLGSLITFIFPALLFLILNVFYIPSEEMTMEKTFGKEYLDYRKKVRRWI